MAFPFWFHGLVSVFWSGGPRSRVRCGEPQRFLLITEWLSMPSDKSGDLLRPDGGPLNEPSSGPSAAPAQLTTVNDSLPMVPWAAPPRLIARSLEGLPNARADQVARLLDELSLAKRQLRAQRAETRMEQKNNELLREELATLKAHVQEAEASSASASREPLGHRDAHLQELEMLKAEHAGHILEIEAKCAREIALLEDKQAQRLNALRNSLRTAEELTLAKSDRIRRLEVRLAKLQAEDLISPRPTRTPSGADDLTAIRGVGPAFARALRREGILTFAQIANFTAEDIERLAPQLGTTGGRIRKDGWVDEARKLLARR